MTNVDENAFTGSEEYNTRDQNFMIAVGANNFFNGERDDPRYSKWVAELVTKIDGELEYEIWEMHPCSVQELESFDEPDSKTASKMEF